MIEFITFIMGAATGVMGYACGDLIRLSRRRRAAVQVIENNAALSALAGERKKPMGYDAEFKQRMREWAQGVEATPILRPQGLPSGGTAGAAWPWNTVMHTSHTNEVNT
jgi:hypothetical protein